MLYEFAIDPQALANKSSCRYFLDHFGVDQGRVIAELPKMRKWAREVLAAAHELGCGPIELKYIEERLSRSSSKFLTRKDRHPYDGNLDWLSNAEARAGAVRAIVARGNPREHPQVLVADRVDEDEALWKVPRQKEIPRDGKSLADLCVPLFAMSEQLLLVDPYLDPTARRWQRGLRGLLYAFAEFSHNRERQPTQSRRIEFHSMNQYPYGQWTEHLSQLVGSIPPQWSLQLKRWNPSTEGDKMHARFVLTEVGGLQVDYGLDAPNEGKTLVTLMDTDLHRSTWRNFQPGTERYCLADARMVEGRGPQLIDR